MSKTIVLSGGGTAGHIYPALALAERLQADGWDVRFAGTPSGLEATLVPEVGIPFKPFVATGFDRAKPWTLVSGVARIAKSAAVAKRWFDQIKPACIVGFGGYVSIPVALAAERAGIPVVVHEQNSVMGMANRFISKRAQAVCLTYPIQSDDAGADAWQVVGNPVRASVLSASREEGRAYLGIPPESTVLVAFGGSRGARHLNQAVAALKGELLAIEGLHVVHMTGALDFERTIEALDLTEDEAARWHVKEYESEMGLVLAAADACLSRAGATSLAEIAARAIPAVLVPYPHATGNHQALNARSCEEAGCAVVIADEDVEGEGFRRAVLEIAVDSELRGRMREAARAMGADDAAGKLARVVESCIQE